MAPAVLTTTRTPNPMTDPYLEFLARKVRVAPSLGFEVAPEEVNPILIRHQPDAVRWACAGGRRALFERFGLGKSVQQLEILRLARAHAGGAVGLVLPLGVKQEFAHDARLLATGEHDRVTDAQRRELREWLEQDPRRVQAVRFIRTSEEIDPTFEGIHLTNYESVRDGKLDPNLFTAASLDEASVLRSFGSKTYQQFLTLFDDVRYRFVATATPSPNRYKELIHYAGFLGVMDTGQALTRWFKRDSSKAGNLQLYPHKEREFWLWVASWALFLQRPSDLGYSDEGYDLPEIRVHYVEVPVDHGGAGAERDGQGKLFRDAAIGVRDAAREKRDTLGSRVAAVQRIVGERPSEHWLLWHDLEVERHALQEAIPAAVSIYGDQDLEEREQAVIDFSEGRIPILSAKPVIAGSGCNFQRHCHLAVYAGIGFKFNDFIQSIHRIQRFQQAHPVEVWIVYAESEREVLASLKAKWTRHEEMVEKMSEIIREFGLSDAAMAQVLTRSIGVERIEARGQGWLVANNDCVLEARGMDEDSVDLVVTSIPFANHYEYSPSYNDLGHTDNNKHFWQQMDFLTPELHRILKPGRIVAVHVKDRIQFGNVTGAGVPTASPFHAETIFHFRDHGFDYMGMITVVTDVVRENNQTYRLGWSEQCKDGTKMGVGSPEYIVLFHKPQTDRSRGYADTPVRKEKADYTRARWQVDAHAFWRSSGERHLTADELAQLGPDKLAKLFTEFSLREVYDFHTHVRIGQELEARGALPSSFMSLAPGSHHQDVWHDVNRMLTLNGDQTRRGLENHICPLQFDIVDRLIERFSNPGELVFDPFGGLFTVPYRALKLGRQGRASELSTAYFMDGIRYLEAAEREMSMPGLFDTLPERSRGGYALGRRATRLRPPLGPPPQGKSR
ncbi:DNA methyltransferase [Xanthomonas theicola]